MKPLTTLEARCYAALQAFQEQHDRLPTHRELALLAEVRWTCDVLHRLVCKGWLESDRLPAPPARPRYDPRHARRMRRRLRRSN